MQGILPSKVGETKLGGAILIYDAGGSPLIGIGANDSGEGRVVQFNRAGKVENVWP